MTGENCCTELDLPPLGRNRVVTVRPIGGESFTQARVRETWCMVPRLALSAIGPWTILAVAGNCRIIFFNLA